MKSAPRITLTDEQRETLTRWSRGRSTPVRLMQRAKIVLPAAEGHMNKVITAELGIIPNTVVPLAALESTRGIDVAKVSSLYETSPVGGPEGQGDYLNAEAEIRTTLAAPRLWGVCQEIESSLGRRRNVHWGPRTIDIDLLLFEDEIHATPELTIPHPLMHERKFVMEPMAEIAPEAAHPTLDQTASSILEGLNAASREESDD